jgi:hypothetical protein
VSIIYKSWEPQPPGAPWAYPGTALCQCFNTVTGKKTRITPFHCSRCLSSAYSITSRVQLRSLTAWANLLNTAPQHYRMLCNGLNSIHVRIYGAQRCYVLPSFAVSDYKAPKGSVSVKVINQCSFCKPYRSHKRKYQAITYSDVIMPFKYLLRTIYLLHYVLINLFSYRQCNTVLITRGDCNIIQLTHRITTKPQQLKTTEIESCVRQLVRNNPRCTGIDH